MTKYLSLAAIVIVIDQVTKQFAAHMIDPYDPIILTSFLNLVLVHNTGAAFGFLNDAGGWQQVFFVAVALGVGTFIVVNLKRFIQSSPQLALALSLILGGALANVIDRIFLGYVIDFVDIYAGDWHWPAFNVADSAITIGAVLIIFDTFGMSLKSLRPFKGRRLG